MFPEHITPEAHLHPYQRNRFHPPLFDVEAPWEYTDRIRSFHSLFCHILLPFHPEAGQTFAYKTRKQPHRPAEILLQIRSHHRCQPLI